MDIKPTLVAISNDARGWLRLWARNFTEAEARLPASASGAPNPLAPHDTTRYPSLSELWTLLERTHTHLLAILDAAGDADLDRPPRVANPYFRSLGQGVSEAALHENYHVGEIAAVRKAIGKVRIA